MKRVLVIGCCGAGKSTFAIELGRATGLPVVHLDQLYWRPGWEKSTGAAWRSRLELELGRDRWILDGNYAGTLERRLEVADTCIFLDMPRRTALGRVLLRRLRRNRPDPLQGCRERLTWEFLQFVWRYPARQRPSVLERLRSFEARGGRVVVLRSAVEARTLLRTQPMIRAAG